MSEKAYVKLKQLFDTSEIPQKVTASLKNGAEAEVCFENNPEIYKAVKEKGRVVFCKGAAKKPQMKIKITEGAVDYLLEICGTEKECIDEYVNRAYTCIMHPTPEKKIEIKPCAGVFTAFRMGYFGMLRFGGRKVIEVIQRYGVKIPGKFLGGK